MRIVADKYVIYKYRGKTKLNGANYLNMLITGVSYDPTLVFDTT